MPPRFTTFLHDILIWDNFLDIKTNKSKIILNAIKLHDVLKNNILYSIFQKQKNRNN